MVIINTETTRISNPPTAPTTAGVTVSTIGSGDVTVDVDWLIESTVDVDVGEVSIMVVSLVVVVTD